jgi:hypothetical protein
MRIARVPLLAALFLACRAEAAEPRQQGSGFVVRGAAGLGVGGTDVAGESTHETGFAGSATLGFAGRRFELDFEIVVQPFSVENPVAGESFRAVHYLPSLRFHAQHVYLRVGVGWASYSWSGPEVLVSSDAGPAFSVALGYELSRPAGVPLSLEAYYRGGSPDFELGSSLAGVQLGLSWYSRKGKQP